MPSPAAPKLSLQIFGEDADNQDRLFSGRTNEDDMLPSRQRLGELLVTHRLLTADQLAQALDEQRRRPQPLGQILIGMGFITEERLLQACAVQKGVSAWHLQHDPPAPEALALVPGNLCRSHMLLPVRVKPDRLYLAMRDPGDIDAIDMVRNITKMRIEPVLASEERLVRAVEEAHGTANGDADVTARLVSEALNEIQGDAGEADGGVTEAEMRPVVGLVNEILAEAVRLRASDIHIEPRKDRVEIRYRLDGQLQRVHEIPIKLRAPLTARLKIMSNLDIVEYRVPQDGRMTFTASGRTVDVRVSVMPAYHGQRIVLRVLDKSATLRALDDLGFNDYNRGLFEEMIRKPYGLVLVTGPTGSGKTTTLYAAINQLKEVSNNIMTCEDPVEYDMDGVNQSNVNEKIGVTFATQLRAIMRQDPDVVLVGEIRDQETAEAAIRAALTGHLVLSTLHCNDAPSAIPRLTDMGIEPFLLSTALIGVTGQRLVRELCPQCKEQYAPSPEDRAQIGTAFAGDLPVLWRAVGCPQCTGTGYSGRMAVHEVFPVAPEVQHAIAACEPMDALRRTASRYGYRTMQEDAVERVLTGRTSLSEARRLVFFDTNIVLPAGPRLEQRAA
ncbi:MAG: Flp pilus assembly complex ATPase component TadA [Armatimonadetes bacterium]|nr:Flp pilus assembly complex ATPase component TadA [Armatimonadota bacterium]